jgi:Zn-dependent protease/CBS domain-containing protein
MFAKRWQLFRLLGLPVYIDLTWIIILLLITVSLTQVIEDPKVAPGLERAAYWLLGLAGAVTFFVCIVLHEFGHAVVARAVGIPIGGITLFLFGGVAEMQDEPRTARSEFGMAIAGPLVSAILTALFFVLAEVGDRVGWARAAVAWLGMMGTLNLYVLIFNLIPAFPLDGGRVLRSIIWGISGNLLRATYWASLLGQGFAWLLIAYGVFRVLGHDWFGGFWMGLIGLFLANAARSSYRQVLIRQTLSGEPVSRFMNREPIVVPPTLNLRHWVEDYVYRYHRKAFPVASDGRLEGYIGTRVLQNYPRDEWDRRTVGEVMRHDLDRVTVRPDADALHALQQMQKTGNSRLIVTDGDRLVGIISLKDLLRFLQLRLEMNHESHEPSE